MIAQNVSSRELDIINGVIAAYREGELDNWDGEGARAVAPGACFWAMTFLRMLPPGIPLPIIGAHSWGDVDLEWLPESRKDRFAIEVTKDAELIYSGLIGPEEPHGQIKLGEEIPSQIRAALEKMFPATD